MSNLTSQELLDLLGVTDEDDSDRAEPRRPTAKVSTDRPSVDYVPAQGTPAVARDRQASTPVNGYNPSIPLTPSPTVTVTVSVSSSTTPSLSSSSSSATPSPVSVGSSAVAAPEPDRRQLIAHGLTYKRKNARKPLPPVKLVAWERLSGLEKFRVIDQLCEDMGALAFTLNASAVVDAELRYAARSGRNMHQIVADKIVRQFRRAGLQVPPFTFRIETAPRGFHRLHLHGVVILGDLEAGEAQAIREAFKRALGYIPGQAGSTQFQAKDFYNFEGKWRRYGSKDIARVAADLGTDKLTYTSTSLKRLAKEAHEARRAAKNAGTTPAVEEQPEAVEKVAPRSLTHTGPLTSPTPRRTIPTDQPLHTRQWPSLSQSEPVDTRITLPPATAPPS